MASKPKRNFVEVPTSASRAASLFALLLVHRAAEVVTRALVLGLFIIGVPFIYVPMYGLHHHNSSYYVPHAASPCSYLSLEVIVAWCYWGLPDKWWRQPWPCQWWIHRKNIAMRIKVPPKSPHLRRTLRYTV